jgi:hypothetical protein
LTSSDRLKTTITSEQTVDCLRQIKLNNFVILAIFALLTAIPAAESAGEKVALFDGKTLQGWTTLDGQPVTKGWAVKDGMIRLVPGPVRSGHIITTREFGDFTLSFEWKIAPGGNSGLKYRVRRFDGKFYGCEYQILDDDGYRTKLRPQQSAAALYDLYEPDKNKRLLPVDKFNSSRIVVRGNSLQHWLNDRLVVSATVGDADWTRRVTASKFADLKKFGRNRYGRIMLTDPGSEVWFRNFQLEVFPTNGAPATRNAGP